MAQHARLGASNAHRWLICPGSVEAEKGMADTTSWHATEGSAAHELAEACLDNGGSPFDWVGYPMIEYNAVTVTNEMANAVQQYIDYVEGIGGEQEYERRVSYNDWVLHGFGTADCIALNGSHLHVVDLKYGKGVQVDAEQNPQGMLYALGAYNDYSPFATIDDVTISIVQPRLDHISEWTISVTDLLAWADWVAERAQAAMQPNAPRNPGEKQCQFCKAKAVCPALREYTHSIVAREFDDLDGLAPPNELSDEQLREALSAKKLIESWLGAVEEHVKTRLDKGESFPGFKLVAGRSVRRWSDAEQAEQRLIEQLGDGAYERSLLSVAKAEKALGKGGKESIADLVEKPQGKPTLAPESDNRPAIGVTVDDFDDV